MTAIVSLSSGCRHRRLQEVSCPPEPPPRSQVRAAARDGARITGTVSVDGNAAPVRIAHARLEPARGEQTTDSLGRFSFDSLAPGYYRLQVSAIGFRTQRSDSLRVADGRGWTVTVPLELKPFDGCPGLAVIVERKPWWKFW